MHWLPAVPFTQSFQSPKCLAYSFRMWIPLHHVSLSSLRLSRSLCVRHWQRPLHHVLDLHNQWIQRHRLLHIVHSVCAGRPHWLTKKLFRDQGRKSLSCSGSAPCLNPCTVRLDNTPQLQRCTLLVQLQLQMGYSRVGACLARVYGITWVCSTHCFGSTHWLGLLMLSFGGGRCSLYEIIALMPTSALRGGIGRMRGLWRLGFGPLQPVLCSPGAIWTIMKT